LAQTGSRDNAGVIAPPPLIFAGALALGLLGDWLWAPHQAAPALQYAVGAAMLIAAVALIVAALGIFRRFRTRPEPWQPTTAIVTTGVYRFTRNPMYVGMALAFAGITLVLNRPYALALLPIAMWIIDFGVIRREERYLEGKFGDDYLRYKERVRRWL
jgi:protein-S-isoprenylcysteine O-methyltransferase Ste14